MASMALAARATRGWPGWRLFLLILGAVVMARTCAMAFNRIVDRNFDAENPRTAGRHLPTGQIKKGSAWTLCILRAKQIVAISWLINCTWFVLALVAQS